MYRDCLKNIAVILGFGSALALAGCGGAINGSGGGATGNLVAGKVYGGQQPISGAQISLYSAGTNGYSTGALSLIPGGSVTSDSNGNFHIPGTYTCQTSNDQLYLTATGGNPGGGVNNSVVLMTALGSCGSLVAPVTINIDEVSTVVAAYALAQFMTPGSTTVGTKVTNVKGLSNAFLTLPNLVDISSGLAYSVTPAGNGVIPQAKINSLANILATCVNSTTGSSVCSSLFAAATPPGGSAPSDTLAAILDIAQNPGNNTLALFNLQGGTPPFQPALTGVPNDWTISVAYVNSGLNDPQLPAVDAQGNVWVPNGNANPGTITVLSPTGSPLLVTGGGLSFPYSVAIDTLGNAWTANFGNNSVSEHSSNGTAISGSSGFTAPGMVTPLALALDVSGNVFTSNGNNTITKLNSSGAPVAQITTGGLNSPYFVAVDSFNQIWVANGGSPTNPGLNISEYSDAGTPIAPNGYTGGGLNSPYAVAIDGTGNVWAANYRNASVSEFNNSGTPLSGSGFATPSGVTALAIDGANTIWTANRNGSISRLAHSGSQISPASGYVVDGALGEAGIALDASGNVWTTDNIYSRVFEYIGAGAPVVVPLQSAVQNGQLGQKP